MKKFLSVLAALAISATGVSNVIACGDSAPTEECDSSDSAQEKRNLGSLLDFIQKAINEIDPAMRDYLKDEINELNKDITLGKYYLNNAAPVSEINELNKKIIPDHKSLLAKVNQYSLEKYDEIAAELEKMQADFDALQAEYDQKINEFKEAWEANKQLNSDLLEAIEKQVKIEAVLKETQDALDQANLDNGQLKIDLAVAIQAKEQADENAKQIQALLDAVNAENLELTNQLEAAQEALRQTEQDLKVVQDALDQANHENTELKEQLKDALAAKEQAEAKVKELTTQLEIVKAANIDLTIEIGAAKESQEQAEAARKAAQEALDQANLANEELTDQIATVNQEKEQVLKGLGVVRADLTEAQALLAQKNEELGQLTIELGKVKSKRTKINTLYLDLTNLQAALLTAINKALSAKWELLPIGKPEIYLVLRDEVRPAMNNISAKISEIGSILFEN